ncbi:MAG: arsenic resistance N-acetyltransferase ArsN2 [Chitinophagales bacterium]
MSDQIEIRPAGRSHRNDITQLLQSENLPVEDLPPILTNFFVALDKNNVIAAVGLEQYDNCGLLRSLAVNSSYRNQNIAGRLINILEKTAFDLRIDSIYLLTETAPQYFEKKGYQKIKRGEVPEILLQSSEFGYVCSTSATVMKKQLINEVVPVS